MTESAGYLNIPTKFLHLELKHLAGRLYCYYWSDAAKTWLAGMETIQICVN